MICLNFGWESINILVEFSTRKNDVRQLLFYLCIVAFTTIDRLREAYATGLPCCKRHAPRPCWLASANSVWITEMAGLKNCKTGSNYKMFLIFCMAVCAGVSHCK